MEPNSVFENLEKKRQISTSILSVGLFSALIFGILSVVIWISGYHSNLEIAKQYSSSPGTLYLLDYNIIKNTPCKHNKCSFNLIECFHVDTTQNQCYRADLYLKLLTEKINLDFWATSPIYNNLNYLTSQILKLNNTYVWYNFNNPTQNLITKNPTIEFLLFYIILGSLFLILTGIGLVSSTVVIVSWYHKNNDLFHRSVYNSLNVN